MSQGRLARGPVRDTWLGTLHELQVETMLMVRRDRACFEQATSTRSVVCEEMGTLVSAFGHTPDFTLEELLIGHAG